MTKTLTLISIRFLFWVLFAFCFNSGALPVLHFTRKFTAPLLRDIVQWFAASVLNLADPLNMETAGSRDTT